MKIAQKSKTKILVIMLIILIITAGAVLAFKMATSNSNKTEEVESKAQVEEEKEEEKPVQIFNGTDRPIAVMIDNHSDAWPQAGLNKAYMVYEIIVEGGETRLMEVFKGQDLEKIGPVRSSRHYFLDYALENDAIYVHFGWSPKAKKDISSLGVNNINGITESGEIFWRVNDKAAPHNAVTNTAKILQSAKSKGYRTTSDKKSVLKYTADPVNLENGEVANKVTIPHSTLQKVTYEYDEENKVYKRYARNKLQSDWNTGETVTTKNIIITFCDNFDLKDSSNKGRQDLKNIGTFNGYYITNGKAIKIKCTKNAREQQTEYKDLEGNEIKVNDGNTFVNICPTSAEVAFE